MHVDSVVCTAALVITGANHGLARCGTMRSTTCLSGVESRTSRGGAFLERSAVVGNMESAVRLTESLGAQRAGTSCLAESCHVYVLMLSCRAVRWKLSMMEQW